MPTNLLRTSNKAEKPASRPGSKPSVKRLAQLTAGRVELRLQLLDTVTADLIWRALPLFSIAETWGDSIHFECPIRAGRERSARLNVSIGDVCYWSEDDRVMIGWGPTPISKPNEIRLMRPCNIWAKVSGDVSALDVVTPGEKVSLSRLA
ncbi:MAG: cyclophilin-like family protein [Pseudomonadota bacterium]